jgi:hypothetical protein
MVRHVDETGSRLYGGAFLLEDPRVPGQQSRLLHRLYGLAQYALWVVLAVVSCGLGLGGGHGKEAPRLGVSIRARCVGQVLI